MKTLPGILLLALFAGALHAQVTVELETVKSGFTNPVDIAHCGDSRLFIVERAGVIKILQPTGQVLATPFLDISGAVHSGGGEQGLLGLAFHPQYAQNGFFYVYYCTGNGNGGVRVSRFSVSGDPNVANSTSELLLWELSQPYANHKGGCIAFGPDGYLYFAPGDGGDVGDPGNRAQNMSLGYGKVHRVDVNSGNPYAIPPTNPFANANNVDTLRTIWASGLRNPFRFSFDALNGDLWIGDVGQGIKEEVDRIPAGQSNGPNFGWRCYEGTSSYNTAGCAGIGAYVAPVIDHTHSSGWCSIIGGRVYRGTRYPNLVGRYIYSDYCLGRILSLRPDGGAGWISETLLTTGASFGIATFGEDVLGELYVANTETGVLSRIIDPSAAVRVAAKVNLEGPYNTGTNLMSDALRTAALVPLTEPYTTSLGLLKVAKGGGEVITSATLAITGVNAMVDWVRVELRSVTQPTIIAASAQGILQSDGDVVAVDNSSPLTFRVGPGNYLVAVRHRNHFGTMTAAPIALSNSITTIDFRSTALLTYGTAARKTTGTTLALWAGDATRDGSLKYIGAGNDRDPVLTYIGGTTPNNSISGYRLEDVNLDGVVKYIGSANDRDPILVNVGGTSPNNTLTQQLP
ncbi:MAG: PQQ-dependent sugar dehydrogenase [Flavobacteriales bacterium]|nr:PQQ-dependent sugar dehydrogenase [Flavobacteriales bacterium]